MKHKYSELDIYEDFIHGNLEPSKLNGIYLLSISKYLKEELEECQDMILGKFKKQGKKYELVERLKISSAHPLATDYFTNCEFQFPNMADEVVPEPIIEQLEVSDLDEVNPIIVKKLKNETQIGIPYPTDWSEIEKDRLKYCYFNHHLNEIVRKTKSNLRADVFKSNEKDGKSLIEGIQRLLLSYLNDLVNQYELKESDLTIEVKPNYTNKDCAALIYLSIVDVLNFLYSHFPEKIDLNQVVPFYSKVANQNDFVSTSKSILKQLKAFEIDEKLFSIISDQLEKVLNLDVQTRITYKELDYFKNFLKSFSRLLQKNDTNEEAKEAITRFLIAFNFNDFLYVEHLINDIRISLKTCDTIDEMEFYLLRKQTELKQINPLTKERLVPSHDDLITSLNEWMINEASYIGRMKQSENDNTTNESVEIIQLTSNINIAELTLLIKMLHDKNYIQSNSRNELSRWIKQSFKNEKNQEFSYQNIRNNMYNILPQSKDRVKNINIDLLNELKSI